MNDLFDYTVTVLAPRGSRSDCLLGIHVTVFFNLRRDAFGLVRHWPDDPQCRAERAYPKLGHTGQCGQGDLSLARRMMERLGISFHFTNTLGNH